LDPRHIQLRAHDKVKSASFHTTKSPRHLRDDCRNPGGGVILGGCRVDKDWNGEVNLEFAEDIKRRCCALAPELGQPEDLKVIQHGVRLRRKF
jgi:hypothetical protein